MHIELGYELEKQQQGVYMENVTPLALLCGVVCIWPMLCAFVAFYLGRRGMPFQVVRRYGPGRARSGQLGKVAIRE